MIAADDALSEPDAVVWSSEKLSAVAATAPATPSATAPERCSDTSRVSPLANANGRTPLSSPAQFSFVVDPETVFASAEAPATFTVTGSRPMKPPERPSTSRPVYETVPAETSASFTPPTEPETPTEPLLTS